MQIVIEDSKQKPASFAPKGKITKSKSTRKRSRSNISLNRLESGGNIEQGNPEYDQSELMKLSITQLFKILNDQIVSLVNSRNSVP